MVISDVNSIAVCVHRAVVDVIIAYYHEILVLAAWHGACGAFLRNLNCVPHLAVSVLICQSITFSDRWHAMLIYLEVCIKHGILVLLEGDPLCLLSLGSIQSFVWQVLVIVVDEGLEVLDLYHLPAILAVLNQWVDL